MSGKDEKLIPYYKIYVYGEDNDKVEEILVNPNINNTLGGVDGIYSLISSKFQQQYTPMNHTMKIKFTNIWYVINDINIYNFCVSGNLSTGDNILIKLLQNSLLNENNNKKNKDNNSKKNNKNEFLIRLTKVLDKGKFNDNEKTIIKEEFDKSNNILMSILEVFDEDDIEDSIDSIKSFIAKIIHTKGL